MNSRFNIKTFKGRIYAWMYAMFAEHNFINLFRLNFHKISDEAYRSAQPTMEQLERYVKKYGFKTIVNLKNANPKSAYYQFEKEKCEKLGITLIDVNVASRAILRPEQVKRAKEIFETAEYPIWIHCKAGADRTGIYATLYQYFRENTPIERTNQLSFWPFGHLKASKAGKVDFYFEQFLKYKKEHPEAEFFEWSQTIANREEINALYQSSKFSDIINDYILRRE